MNEAQLERNTVYNGCCLELMRSIPDNSIDMILCDLPYSMTGCTWDNIIPIDLLWAAYKRIIKNNGVIVLTASQPFTSLLVSSNLKAFKCEWVWEKDNGSNYYNAKIQPFKVHESVLIFSYGKPAYYPQKIPGKIMKIRGDGLKKFLGKYNHKKISYASNTRYPRSIQKFNIERGLHPTQKPVKLLEYFIKTYSKLGDLVLDNCAGAGSTALAARNLGRDFILIEKEKRFYDVCIERLQKPNPEPKPLKKPRSFNNFLQMSLPLSF